MIIVNHRINSICIWLHANKSPTTYILKRSTYGGSHENIVIGVSVLTETWYEQLILASLHAAEAAAVFFDQQLKMKTTRGKHYAVIICCIKH